jgi:very-short-patch-repair endonuclease
MDSTPINDVARARLTQVFDYLKALHQHRNPAVRQVGNYSWKLSLRDLPAHESVLRGWLEGEAADEPVDAAEGDDTAADDAFILRVRRPALTGPPARPEVLSGWVEGDWRDPYAGLHLRPLPPAPPAPEEESDEEAEERRERQRQREAEHRQRQQVFALWLGDRWQPWALAERPAREAMKVFDSLYDLHGQLQREAERLEIVVGDGMLSWRQPSGGILHPLLLQRLQLEFDPDVPQFTLTEADQPVELYAGLGQAVPTLDPGILVDSREELDRAPVHPLSARAADEYLRRLVNRLSPSEGEFMGETRLTDETDAPRIARDPWVFLRTRAQGYGLAIERVLEDLRTREELPHPILGAVGIEVSHPGSGNAAAGGPAWEEPADVLLSKPANAEQVRIARRLESQWNVLVQGPPGTGKTHTIANLLGHLLAQGKSVLVTSHTTKALRVLRHQVVEALQPLCVSVLDSDAASRQELEDSVRAIIERLGTSDADGLRSEGERLAEQRKQVLERIRTTRTALIDAQTDEYRAVVVDGKGYDPSAAARQVREDAEEHGWVPGPVQLGAPMPLSEEEVGELYRTNGTVSPADEAELGFDLPHPASLPAPVDFEKVLVDIAGLDRRDLRLRADLWEPGAATDPDRVRSILDRLRQAVGAMTDTPEWQLEVIAAGASAQSGDRAPWEELVREIEALVATAVAARELDLRHGPGLAAGEPIADQIRLLGEIREHLRSGGSLGTMSLVFRPAWKRLIQACSVSGERPSEAEHFEALEQLATLTRARDRFRARWNRQLQPLGAPAAQDLGPEPERTADRFLPSIRRSLAWYEAEWSPVLLELRGLGLRWDALLAEQPPRLDRHGDVLRLRDAVVDQLPAILESRAAALRRARLEERLLGIGRILAPFEASEVVDRLRAAVASRDPVAYASAYSRVVELHARSTHLRRRRELLDRLAPVAQGWARALQERAAPHDAAVTPGGPARAWLWRQLHDELERRGRVSLGELQQVLSVGSNRLRARTAELIDRRAWEAQVRRTTTRQQQALMGYRGVVRKIGKGTGLRAPRLKLEAQRLMAECRGAVPVWIMPLARVADTFDPRTTRFDVVIIDEASQCDMLGLIAVYLGKKVVVVGDDEQVSPDAVGQKVDEVERLISVHLKGIPNALLYDGQRSIYDLANESFGSPIRLVEHFRCVPDIIQFSNHLSYGGTIKPLRDASGVRLLPHTVAHRTTAAVFDDRAKTNREEAETIVSLIAAAIEQPEYADMTFGVISMLGDQQALLIEQMLHARLTPQQYAHHRLLCGNASQFQGDERDVMFLSLVHGSPEQGLLRIVNEGPLDATKKRYNVAASRARDQMWVVHSMDPALHLKPGDLRLRLIEHVQNPDSTDRRIERAAELAESPFEVEVQKRLIAAGFDVVPQWKVGGYRIDIVVQGNGKRLAVECDGDRFHPPEQLHEDMARQAILERLGWTFTRIRGTQFFRDPDAAMEPVFARLRKMGIEPAGSATESLEPRGDGELAERLRRRADELRRLWRSGLDAPQPAEPPAEANQLPREAVPPVVQQTGPVAPPPGNAAETVSRRPEPDVASASSDGASPSSDGRERGTTGFRAESSGIVEIEPYRVAPCPFGHPQPDRFQSDLDVLRCIVHVAQAEAPVHEEVLMRRTAEYFGVQRVGSQIRARMRVGLRRLAREKRITLRDLFVWLPTQNPDNPPLRGPSAEGYVRSIEEISLDEIRACARVVSQGRSEGDLEGLYVEIARAFGFNRTGRIIHARIAKALDGSILSGEGLPPPAAN